MKLSDFKDEEAIDVLADIIEPAARIMADNGMREMIESGVPPVELIRNALKARKKEVIEIIATLHRVPVEECHFNVASLARDLMDIVSDPELTQVFTSQVQTTASVSSGSAMETIAVEA